jgi:hypothetical protein
MIAELVQDVKTELRELPWFAATVVLAVAVGIGLNVAVFYEADGDELRVTASRAQSIEEQVSRLRAHSCSRELKPGFTVLVGLRQYSVELSVPMAGVRSLFDDVRANVADAVRRSAMEHAA